MRLKSTLHNKVQFAMFDPLLTCWSKFSLHLYSDQSMFSPLKCPLKCLAFLSTESVTWRISRDCWTNVCFTSNRFFAFRRVFVKFVAYGRWRAAGSMDGWMDGVRVWHRLLFVQHNQHIRLSRPEFFVFSCPFSTSTSRTNTASSLIIECNCSTFS